MRKKRKLRGAWKRDVKSVCIISSRDRCGSRSRLCYEFRERAHGFAHAPAHPHPYPHPHPHTHSTLMHTRERKCGELGGSLLRATRRPSSRALSLECVGRVYTVNISMNLRCALIPNGLTNRSSSGNALLSRAFALVARRRRRRPRGRRAFSRLSSPPSSANNVE